MERDRGGNDFWSSVIPRRELLKLSGLGFGALAAACILHAEGAGATVADPRRPLDLKPRPGHFPARARAVIQLVQNGGPSQMDLFDFKPELQKRQGQPIPGSVETFQMGNTTTLL